MKSVNIYIGQIWKGCMRGSGRAAAIIVYENKKGNAYKKEIMVEMENGTRNRMLLMAVTKALYVLKEPCSVGIYVDEDSIATAIKNAWPQKWRENGWKNNKGREPANTDIWKILCPLLDKHYIGVMPYIGTCEKELEKVLKGVDEVATNDAEG